MTFLLRQLLILVLPVLAVTTTFLAGANKGPVRIYWTLCAIGVTFIQGSVHLRKEVVLRTAREEAIAARTNLAITVFDASQPVVATLQNIADADNPEDRRSSVDILIRCTVGLAHTQLGHQTGIRCSVLSNRRNTAGFSRRRLVVGRTPRIVRPGDQPGVVAGEAAGEAPAVPGDGEGDGDAVAAACALANRFSASVRRCHASPIAG